jgi:adenosylcobinamide kinase/adenosylcobinamide-phosphate guanylyltransferase
MTFADRPGNDAPLHADSKKGPFHDREHPFVYVSGGCRSGKSAYAQRVAESLSPACLYLATARPRDAEMRRRVALHKQARGPAWKTLEIVPEQAFSHPDGIGVRLAPALRPDACILLDCLTLWVSACMEYARTGKPPTSVGQEPQEDGTADIVRHACGGLLAALWRAPGPVIVVSGEVGLGLVPSSPHGREFRDLAGLANQQAAGMAHTAIFMVSGLPLAVKGSLFPLSCAAAAKHTEKQ